VKKHKYLTIRDQISEARGDQKSPGKKNQRRETTTRGTAKKEKVRVRKVKKGEVQKHICALKETGGDTKKRKPKKELTGSL